MDKNPSREFVYQPYFEPPRSCENQQPQRLNKDDKMWNVVRIDRQEVSAWALSVTRRGFDILVSVFALTFFLPVIGAVAVAVRFSSRGPVLFQQQRMGRHGRVFTLYKFRSMRLATEQLGAITVTGDSRITRVGRLLRKYKLDELPQFWNVLRGDMSIVGPRPKLPHHEGLHMPFRPGITGPATLAFRSEEELLSQIPYQHLDAYYDRFVKPRKAEIDLEYMRTATLKTDLGVLWQTAASCISSTPTKFRADLPEFNHTELELDHLAAEIATEPVLSA